MPVEVRNQASKKGEIYIYDTIGADFFGGVGLNDVKDAFNTLEKATEITIRINSPGGSMFEGIAIYNYLRQQRVKTISVVEGVAASAASLVALGADVVTMADGAFYMIHNAHLGTFGDRNQLREAADQIEQFDIQLRKFYSQKTGLSVEDIAAMMDAETWLSADDALAKNFIDEVKEPLQVAAYCDPTNFKNAPASLKIVNDSGTKKAQAMATKIKNRAKVLKFAK